MNFDRFKKIYMKPFFEEDDKEIYQFFNDIYEAHKNNKLIIFIGAGMSRMFGIEGWYDFSNSLLNKSLDSKSSYSLEEKKQLQKSILNEGDARYTISAAKEIMGDDLYYSSMISSLKMNLNKNSKAIHKEYLSHLEHLTKKIITTNADNALDGIKVEQVFRKKEEENLDLTFLDTTGQDKDKIIYLHGKANNKGKKGLVFTVDEYLKLYGNSDLKSKFNELSKTHTFLFIGYGFRDLQLLDFLINSTKEVDDQNYNFYCLEPYFKNEEESFKVKSKIYETYHIKLIRYDGNYYVKDKINDLYKSHLGKIEILKLLCQYIFDEEHITSKDIEEVSDTFSSIPSSEGLSLIKDKYEKAKTNEDKYYLIKCIYKSDKQEEWLYYLLDNYYDLYNYKKYNDSSLRMNDTSLLFLNIETLLECGLNFKNKDKLNKYVLDLLQYLIDKDVLYSDRVLNHSFFTYLLSSKELMDEDIVLTYFNNVTNKNYKYKGYYFLFKQIEVVKEYTKKTKLKLFEIALNNLMFETKYDNTYFLSFYNNLGFNVVKEYFKDIYDLCVEILKSLDEKECRDFNSYLIAFDKLRNCDDFSVKKPQNYLFIILMDSLKYFNEDELITIKSNLKELMDKYRDSIEKQTLISKFYIYLINTNYSLFKDELSSLYKTYNDKNHYSEMFSLINNNGNIFNEEDINNTINFINSIHFYNKDNEDGDTLLARKDLFDLLLKNILDTSRFNEEIELIKVNLNNLNVKINNTKINYSFIEKDPYKKSRYFYFYKGIPNQDEKQDVIDKSLKLNSFKEFYDFITGFDEFKINSYLFNNYDKLNNKFNFDDNFNNLDFDKFFNLPNSLIEQYVYHLFNKKNEEKINQLLSHLIELLKLNKHGKCKEQRLIYLIASRFTINNNISYVKEFDKKDILLNSLYSYINDDNFIYEIYEGYSSDLMDNLFNEYSSFNILYLLFALSNESKWIDIKDNIILKNIDKYDELIKSVLVANLNKLYKLDKRYIEDNISNFFKTKKEHNYSFIAFYTYFVFDNDLLSLLNKNNLITLILNNDNKESFLPSHFAYQLIYYYLTGNLSDIEIIKSIFKTQAGIEALTSLLNSKDSLNNINKDKVINLLKIFKTINNKRIDKHYSRLICSLLNNIDKYNGIYHKTFYDLGTNLLKKHGFNLNDLYELEDIFKSNNLNNKEKLDLFIVFIRSDLKNYELYMDNYIKEIISSIDFIDLKEIDKTYIIYALVNYNNDLAIYFNNLIKNK